jgi:hypothetical protein
VHNRLEIIGEDPPSDPVLPAPKRILVGCHEIVLSGGLLRFERVGAALRDWGHELCFAALAGNPHHWPTTFPVMSFDEASGQRWDAVMIPGAGFPDETIARFSGFRDERFGVRVQHILNDQQRRSAFKAVNKSFKPHIVVFNNDHWPPGSFTEFVADRFHVLLGAVNTTQFRPKPKGATTTQAWVIGGLVNKNPEPLIGALDLLGPEVSLRLYGIDVMGLAERYANLIEIGRLRLMGPLFGNDLTGFYHGVDCVVMTETMAGWANLAAEAMASGVPVVCTRHGTTAFAHHEKTALLVDDPSPINLATSIRRLQDDPGLYEHLCRFGREFMESFPWSSYAADLLTIIEHNNQGHYFHAPNLGLFGKWPVDRRLRGLELLLKHADGSSVVEFGAAEGVIGRKFLENGARLLHGFEFEVGRVEVARSVCAPWSQHEFCQADLSDWDQFEYDQLGFLQEGYDIVLYLSLQQHLPTPSRLITLRGAIRLAKRFFAFRAPAAVYELDGVEALLHNEGFICVSRDRAPDCFEHLEFCRVYERTSSS